MAPGVVEHLSPFADYAITAGDRDVDPGGLLRDAGLDVDTSAPDEATLLWRKLCFLGPFALLTLYILSGTAGRLAQNHVEADPQEHGQAGEKQDLKNVHKDARA